MNTPLRLDPAVMRWHHEPAVWQEHPGGTLTVRADPDTDFWQRTHYGFRRDNGHVLAYEVGRDFRCQVTVRTAPSHQYDQAGLMVRAGPECWLKTSIEFEPHGPCRLGAVVTNAGFSDWSTQDVPNDRNVVRLRVQRAGNVFVVEHFVEGEQRWSQLRLAQLGQGAVLGPLAVGVYCCAPTGPGFVATFSDFVLA